MTHQTTAFSSVAASMSGRSLTNGADCNSLGAIKSKRSLISGKEGLGLSYRPKAVGSSIFAAEL